MLHAINIGLEYLEILENLKNLEGLVNLENLDYLEGINITLPRSITSPCLR